MLQKIYIRVFGKDGPINTIKNINELKDDFHTISDLLIEHKATLFQFLQASTIKFSSISKEFPLYHIGEIIRHPDNLEPCIKHNARLIKLRPNDFVFAPKTGDCTYGQERLVSISPFFSLSDIKTYTARQKS